MAIGESVPMGDARERVTGTIEYAMNFELPGMPAGRVLRSPTPKPRALR